MDSAGDLSSADAVPCSSPSVATRSRAPKGEPVNSEGALLDASTIRYTVHRRPRRMACRPAAGIVPLVVV